VPDQQQVPQQQAATNSVSKTYEPTLFPGTIAAGNLIKIESYDDEKISADYRVTSEGKILLPYQIEASVAGLTLPQLSETLQKSFQPYFRTKPKFGLQIIESSVYVNALGLVAKPGAYLVSPTGSLDEVIGLAGGLEKNTTGQSSAQYVSIDNNQAKASIKLSEYFAGNKALVKGWAGGEKVFFQNANEEGNTSELFNKSYVQVMGQVKNPGDYPINTAANIFAYLMKAGGPTDRANTNNMLLVRMNEKNEVETYPVALNNLSQAPQIQGGDVLFVQADNPTDLQKDASVFGSFASVISSIATTVLIGAGL